MNTTIYIDFARESVPVVVFAKQKDDDRSLTIFPTENGAPLSMDNGTTAELHVYESDGTTDTLAGDVTIDRNSYITVELTGNALSVGGWTKCELSLTSNNKHITSQTFYLNVCEAL